ncbi:MAG: hypothetical protein DRP66_00855 [Planctomycetota bacterium]|nr:MAG: hypothetical protein DRP66_00855 [Planctomycetota bacterium]
MTACRLSPAHRPPEPINAGSQACSFRVALVGGAPYKLLARRLLRGYNSRLNWPEQAKAGGMVFL